MNLYTYSEVSVEGFSIPVYHIGYGYDPEVDADGYSDKTYSDALPALNINLLSQIVEWAIVDHEDMDEFVSKFGDWGSWDQTRWGKQIKNGVCQTACCIAGQVAVQSGFGFVLEKDFYESRAESDRRGGDYSVFTASVARPLIKVGTDDKGNDKFALDDDKPVQLISEIGKTRLGLTSAEADVLFDGDNDITAVVYIATEIAKARGTSLNVDPSILAQVDLGGYKGDSFESLMLNRMYDGYYNETHSVNLGWFEYRKRLVQTTSV